MIICYTGNPGGGKTTGLAYRAMQAQKEGRMVFSNVNIKGAYKITLEDLIEYRIPEGSVVIIDEAGRWFNSHNWKELPPEIYDMFTMHRHLQMDMYLGVMSFARISKSLRECIELTYWARNYRFLPFHRYEGFYDLEKVGSMRRDYDISHLVWKTKKVRSMFNTFAMKDHFSYKAEIPLIEWKDFKHSNKRLYKRIIQQLRIKKKRYQRGIKIKRINKLADQERLQLRKQNPEAYRTESKTLLEEWEEKNKEPLTFETEYKRDKRKKPH